MILFVIYVIITIVQGKIENTVVKIIHEGTNGNRNAIKPQGDNVVGSNDLREDNTEWIIAREKGNKDNFVEISPSGDQSKRLIVDNNGNLKMEPKSSNGLVKWEVKEENNHHTIKFGNRCLTMDDDLGVKAKDCIPNDVTQRFMITARTDRTRKKYPKVRRRGRHSHRSISSVEIQSTSTDDHEIESRAYVMPRQLQVRSELVPMDDTENVHYTITSTEVVKSILTLSDTTLKTIYETKTQFVTSTITETKSLDYTKTITSTTTLTHTTTTTIEEVVKSKKKEPRVAIEEVPQIKEPPNKLKAEEIEKKKIENIKDSVELISNVLDKQDSDVFEPTNKIQDYVKMFDGDKDTDLITISKPDMFSEPKSTPKPSACQQPLLIDLRNMYPNNKCATPTQAICCPVANTAQPQQPIAAQSA